MKKIFTLCTVMLLSLTVLFAQESKRPLTEKQLPTKPARGINTLAKQAKNAAKVSGNPVWQDTMSYCGNEALSSAVGVNDNTTPVYWAIKIEAAALVGRNSITDVDFYVYAAGAYTLSIAYGSTSPGTAVLTQSITATSSDESSWKNIHLTSPLSITQNQDMWIILMNSDANYPAAGVTGNSYDNGKYISLDGSSWVLVSTYNLDYTWMIRAISDTYTVLPPSVNIDGPATVLAGDTATFTANGAADSYAWTIPNADYTSSNGATAHAMWTTPGTKQVIVAATNTAGTGYDTLDVNVISCDPVTTLPWFEDFENASPCWQIADVDASGVTWGIGDVSSYAYSGTNALYCQYHSSQSDDWAISPAITIPSNATDINLTWWSRIRSTTYPETYEVLISTNGTNTSDFTMVFSTTDSTIEYKKESVSLAAYAGQTINVAFRYRSTDMYYLFIDNVRIGGPELPEGVAANGPTEATVGTTVSFTATSMTEGVTFAWTADNGTPATGTGETFNVSWAAAGTYNVILAATNAVGTVYDTVSVEVFNCADANTVPFATHFDSVSSLRCWTSIDANNDGFTWSILDGYGAVNYSYDNESSSPITPDDYLVSPAITIPASGNFELFFRVYGLDQNYPQENYSVYISTENHSAADFVNSVFTETLANGNPVEHSVNLANYAGQTIYIAFRHHNCNDMFALTVEAVEIRGMQVPEVAISAPTTAIAGNTVTLTAVGDNIDSYAWTIEGATPATATTESVDVVWSNAGTYTVSLTATNAAGSSTATATVNVVSCDPISTFPYSEDFENSDYTCWTIIDADGDGMNWVPGFAFSQPNGHNGSNGILVSHSYYSGTPLTPDNWIYTPAIQVPANGSLYFSWWEKGQDPEYAAEHYAVYVANQPTTAATTAAYEGTTTGEWVRRTINLSSYAGQTVYVGFRHYNVTDQFILDIDDILISTEAVGIDEASANSVKVYPNPATDNLYIEGEDILGVEVLDMNGRVVRSIANAGTIDMSELSNGVYMVRTTTGNGISVRKIVKK